MSCEKLVSEVWNWSGQNCSLYWAHQVSQPWGQSWPILFQLIFFLFFSVTFHNTIYWEFFTSGNFCQNKEMGVLFFHGILFSLFEGIFVDYIYGRVYFSLCLILAISGRSRTQWNLNPRKNFPIYSMYHFINQHDSVNHIYYMVGYYPVLIIRREIYMRYILFTCSILSIIYVNWSTCTFLNKYTTV